MRKILPLLIGILMLIPSFTFAQPVDAENADYYIEGDLEVTSDRNGFVFKLHNPIGKGIYFTPKTLILGQAAEEGLKSFEFEKASTDCQTEFNRGLYFFKQDPNTLKWQWDSEVKNGMASYANTKEMVFVLVLDCSKSMGSEFLEAQRAARSFIEKLGSTTDYNGNVSIGIVGFNYQTYEFPIRPLTNSSAEQLYAFIDSLTTARNTTLYAAVERGVEMIEEYAKKMSNDRFDGAALVTFTDGYDNGSQNLKKGIFESKEYQEYLSRLIHSTKIKGMDISNLVVAFKGTDVSDYSVFRSALESIAYDKEEEAYYEVKRMKELEGKFVELADKLLSRWRNLKCYIPTGFQGRVRWVLDCKDRRRPTQPQPAQTEEPRPVKPPFDGTKFTSIGLVVGSWNGLSIFHVNKNFAVDLDLAFKASYIAPLGDHGNMSDGYYDYHYGGHYKYVNMLGLNLNMMGLSSNTKKLRFLMGGGISAGWNTQSIKKSQKWHYYNSYHGPISVVDYSHDCSVGWYLGANLIVGIITNLRIPLEVQFDFRPGYAMQPNNWGESTYLNENWNEEYYFFNCKQTFDWALCLSIRYRFGN